MNGYTPPTMTDRQWLHTHAALAALILIALALAGCGTMHGLVLGAGQLASGIGADLQSASRGIGTSTHDAGQRFSDDGGCLETYDKHGRTWAREDVR